MALSGELRQWVAQQLSPIARPDDIRFTDSLPKTRSGKIMRRLLRAIARGEEITQDISTLENPAIVAQLRGEEGPVRKAPSKPAPRKRAAPKRSAAKSAAAKKSVPRKPAPKGAKSTARGKPARRRVSRRPKRSTRPRRPARRSTK